LFFRSLAIGERGRCNLKPFNVPKGCRGRNRDVCPELRAKKADALPNAQRPERGGFTPFRDITCDGIVMAETAEFCGCDGVMARIDAFF
jgi:hypothetical protein